MKVVLVFNICTFSQVNNLTNLKGHT